MAGTISQRISLEGSEDIRKKLEALGVAGEQAFKQIQDAAKKPISDPAQIDKTKQSLNQLAVAAAQLGPQFQALATAARAFGTEGAQATQKVTTGLNETSAAAQQAGAAMQQASQQANAAGQSVGGGLISAATAFKIAAVGIVAAIAAITDALTKGAVETGTAIAAQAEKIGLSIPQWLNLRKGILSAGLSAEDFASKTSKVGEAMKLAKDGTAQLGSTTEKAFQTANGVITVFNGSVDKTKSEANTAATTLRKLGVSWEAIMSGDTNRALREAAQHINEITDATKREQAGLAIFGKEWENIVKVLTGNQVIDPLKASRDLTAEQVEKTVKLKAAWDDLSAAIRATKDQIGALFLDPALARAEWLTKIVDETRELIKLWSGLSDIEKETFLAGLGDSPAEQVFKTLIAVGDQLAGIWRDVLVPAGTKLLALFGGISDSIEGVSKSRVAAFFITATVAAAGLAVALKAIGLALTPFSLLLSLFGAFGPLLIAAGVAAFLFWDKLKEGANAALALIPNSLHGIENALQALFRGDLASAWILFSASAVVAFATIKQAFLNSEFGQQMLGIVNSLVSAFNGLEAAAEITATAINKIFGTNLTGAGIGAILAVGQMTGALQALASVAVIAGVAFSGFLRVVEVLASAVGGLPVLFGAVAIALTGLILYLDPTIWERWKNTATDAVNAVKNLVATLGLADVGKDLNPLVWDIFANAALIAINSIMSALRGLTLVIRGITAAIEAMQRALANMRAMQAPGAPLPEPGGIPMAGGGLLGGRGTGTSDSNLAWVSRGEHIMPARAVSQPGVLAFLEALRSSGGNLRSVLDGMGRFAEGGLIRGPIPAFAGGGLAGGHLGTLTLGLPSGGSVTVRASVGVAEELRREAALAQVRSGGRKPSRYS